MQASSPCSSTRFPLLFVPSGRVFVSMARVGLARKRNNSFLPGCNSTSIESSVFDCGGASRRVERLRLRRSLQISLREMRKVGLDERLEQHANLGFPVPLQPVENTECISSRELVHFWKELHHGAVQAVAVAQVAADSAAAGVEFEQREPNHRGATSSAGLNSVRTRRCAKRRRRKSRGTSERSSAPSAASRASITKRTRSDEPETATDSSSGWPRGTERSAVSSGSSRSPGPSGGASGRWTGIERTNALRPIKSCQTGKRRAWSSNWSSSRGPSSPTRKWAPAR